jgi:copper(I)-binding protein
MTRCFFFCVALLLAACDMESRPPLVANDVVVTAPMPGMKMSAAYMSLTNNADLTLRISHVTSPQYESVELHETTIENGVARMRALPGLEISAGATVRLKRGAKHLMLAHPAGNSDTVTLQFFDGDDLLLSVNATLEPRID